MKEDKIKSSDKNNKQGWVGSLLGIISIPLAGIVIISVTVFMGCAGGQGPGGWMGGLDESTPLTFFVQE